MFRSVFYVWHSKNEQVGHEECMKPYSVVSPYASHSLIPYDSLLEFSGECSKKSLVHKKVPCWSRSRSLKVSKVVGGVLSLECSIIFLQQKKYQFCGLLITKIISIMLTLLAYTQPHVWEFCDLVTTQGGCASLHHSAIDASFQLWRNQQEASNLFPCVLAQY